MLAACQKEETTSTTILKLFAEEPGTGASKLAVDGLSVTWCTGDVVRINNNGVFSVLAGGNGATVEVQSLDNPFVTPLRAVSPDIAGASSNITSNSYRVKLPSTYEYATTTLNGVERQHLAIPMAAYTASGDQLFFKYLTGALTVNLTNPTGSTIYVEDITITSNLNQLSGYMTIDFSNLTNITSTMSNAPADRTVTMKCNRKAIAGGSTLSVQIPVLPVASANRFTVKVRYCTDYDQYDSESKPCYTFSKTQPSRTSGTGNSLGRGQLGYVPVTLQLSNTGDYSADYFFKDAEGYYLINTPEELSLLSTISDSLTHGQKVKLTGNINMNGQTYFKPIENVTELEGGNHTISNLELWSVGTNSSGLLCDRNSASEGIVVKNLKMENCTLKIQPTTEHAGFLVGYAAQRTTITNCTVSNNSKVHIVTANRKPEVNIGGMCGYVQGVANLTDCDVSSFDFEYATNGLFYGENEAVNCGGLIGRTGSNCASLVFNHCYVRSTSTTEIKNAASGGQLRGSIRFGGLVGYHSASDITFYNNSEDNLVWIEDLKVGAKTVYAGALCGYMRTGKKILLPPAMGARLRTLGSVSVNAGTSYTGNSGNGYLCGSGNAYEIHPSAVSNTFQFNLTFNLSN